MRPSNNVENKTPSDMYLIQEFSYFIMQFQISSRWEKG